MSWKQYFNCENELPHLDITLNGAPIDANDDDQIKQIIKLAAFVTKKHANRVKTAMNPKKKGPPKQEKWKNTINPATGAAFKSEIDYNRYKQRERTARFRSKNKDKVSNVNPMIYIQQPKPTQVPQENMDINDTNTQTQTVLSNVECSSQNESEIFIISDLEEEENNIATSTPRESTPRKSTPRKSTPRKSEGPNILHKIFGSSELDDSQEALDAMRLPLSKRRRHSSSSQEESSSEEESPFQKESPSFFKLWKNRCTDSSHDSEESQSQGTRVVHLSDGAFSRKVN